jgi:hypothetical protein
VILDLDDDRALDPGRAGAKAAWLARGRRAGLPVLPGRVVPASASRPAMELAVEVMAQRGSGGARLRISQEPLDTELERELLVAVDGLGDLLVVRSSSLLEAGGEWSGAFTSYLDIRPEETPVAVRGCWASAFTVHTLERYEAAGIEPGSAPMAVLIQPFLDAQFGGVARYADDEITVIGVAGSPAPLVQGWDPGAHARVSGDVVRGDPAVALMGENLILAVAAALRKAHETIGATSCEWAAVDGEVTLLQLMQTPDRLRPVVELPAALASASAAALARLVRRYPGPLGEALVLPWAVAEPERFLAPAEPADVDPLDALIEATELARGLVAEIWHGPKPETAARARDSLRELRSDDPGSALDTIAALRAPDPERAQEILALLARVRHGLVEARAVSRPEIAWHIAPDEALAILRAGRAPSLRARIGFDRWEPFDAGVVVAHGAMAVGSPAAPGLAAGRMCFVDDPADAEHFRPRDVVVGTHPLPKLAALLWDASAVVTTGGGPAAHLFESARALAIPAVAAIHLDDILGGDPATMSGKVSLAVDGVEGRVWAHEW